MFRVLRDRIDWVLLGAIFPIALAGFITMNSFVGTNIFFEKQILWFVLSCVIFFGASFVDWSFLRRTGVVTLLFVCSVLLLVALFILGVVTKGAMSRFNFGVFFVQPADFATFVLVLLLAKYFSRRHVAIAHVRHILVSGFYALLLFVLIFLQPDFGGAITVFCVWFGMVLLSGISKKHLLGVLLCGGIVFAGLWVFVFQDYQKARVLTFLNPLTDIHGKGYSAYQSTVTVGSGKIVGKGVGYGTQSRLAFLPAYETDFIFAAFAEEWGFVGVLLLFMCFALVFWRLMVNALRGATNFEILYGLGFAVLLFAHFIIHVGMNIGLLPVTGITLPFMSYGGSHLVIEFLALGIVMGQRASARAVHHDLAKNEFVGPQ